MENRTASHPIIIIIIIIIIIMLAYMAPVCQKTSEAPDGRHTIRVPYVSFQCQ